MSDEKEIKTWLKQFESFKMGVNPGLAVTYDNLRRIKTKIEKLEKEVEELKDYKFKYESCSK